MKVEGLQEQTRLVNSKQTKLNSTVEKPDENRSNDHSHKVGEFHEADEYLKDNEYILRGYRIKYNTSWKVFKRYFLFT